MIRHRQRESGERTNTHTTTAAAAQRRKRRGRKKRTRQQQQQQRAGAKEYEREAAGLQPRVAASNTSLFLNMFRANQSLVIRTLAGFIRTEE